MVQDNKLRAVVLPEAELFINSGPLIAMFDFVESVAKESVLIEEVFFFLIFLYNQLVDDAKFRIDIS